MFLQILKYNKNHDPKNGRFATADGVPVAHTGVEFVSPNQESGVGFERAKEKMHSQEQSRFKQVSSQIDRMLGMESRTEDALGAWATGAENSSMTVIPRSPDYETVLVSASMKGLLAQQMGVVAFRAMANGKSRLYEFNTNEQDAESLSKELAVLGLDYHTLVPTETGHRVHLFVDQYTSEYAHKVKKAAGAYGGSVTKTVGKGEMYGSWDSREEGKAKYEQAINAYLRKHPELKDQWKAIRSRHEKTG